MIAPPEKISLDINRLNIAMFRLAPGYTKFKQYYKDTGFDENEDRDSILIN